MSLARIALVVGLTVVPFIGLALSDCADPGQPPAGPPFSPAVRAGRFVYVSGMLPTEASGSLAAGDIKAQTRRVLDNLSALLPKYGSRIDRAAAVTVYLRSAADFASMNEVYRTYWPKDPPARTTVIADLVIDGALLEVSIVAVAGDAERQVVHPRGWSAAANPYSYGVRSGDTLFTSGLLSRNGKDNAPVPGDMTTQTRTVLANAHEILSAAGMSLSDVVTSRVYITDTADFQEMNAAYRTAFPKDPPSRATVKVGLTAPPYRVEISMVAVRGTDRTAIATPGPDGAPGKPNPNLSSAVRVGDRLYLSGMLGFSEATRGDARAETRETLERLARTLTAAGFSWPDVVESTVYLTDVTKFGQMNDVYRSTVSMPYPARATVRTGLMSPDALVEIAMTAVRRR